MVVPVERLKALQNAAHSRRCAALATAIREGHLDDDEALDFTPTLILHDEDMINATLDHLRFDAGYPIDAMHTVAVKANPVGGVLRLFRDRGLGAEAASLGELMQALECGFSPDRIVFDSPAKTRREIEFALAKGVAVNLDNFEELERAAEVMEAHPEWWAETVGAAAHGVGGAAVGADNTDGVGGGGGGSAQHTTAAAPSSSPPAPAPARAQPPPQPPRRLVGLRVNPQVGEGSIAALSTGGQVSKFGFPLLEQRRRLVEAFARHPWLNMLHLHVGSQGMPAEAAVEGAARVWSLLEEIDAACGPGSGSDGGGGGGGGGAGGVGRVRALDIGGGLSVDFSADAPPPLDAGRPDGLDPVVFTRFQEQAALLRRRVPGLFDPSRGVRLITENGRSLLAKSGFVATRVEYVKASGGRRIAVAHAGADLMTRACLLPETWALRVRVCDATGAPKEAAAAAAGGGAAAAGGAAGCEEAARGGVSSAAAVELVEQDVAGPLCFQGDRLATAALLPRIDAGDYILALDAGAYALSMCSRYNSRPSPAVLGFRAARVDGGGRVELTVLRGRERVEDVVRFWNL